MQAERKPLYTSIAAAVLVIIVAFAVYGRWGGAERVQKPAPDSTTSSSTPTTGALPVEVVTIASSTELLAIRAEYPRFPGSPKLTAAIERYVAATIEEFRKNATDNAAAREATLPAGAAPTKVTYSLDLWWEHAQLNDRYASLILHLYAFDGGANGRQLLQSYNWDVAAQREVSLGELFPDDDGYLARISEYARRVLASTLGEDTNTEFLTDGTQPIASSFQWFTFTDQAVTFYFPKYQVAPGAAGEQKVVMPRNVPGLF